MTILLVEQNLINYQALKRHRGHDGRRPAWCMHRTMARARTKTKRQQLLGLYEFAPDFKRNRPQR